MEKNEKAKMKFEETELRLGFPGGSMEGEGMKNSINSDNNGNHGIKRGYEEIVDLRLNLSSNRFQSHDQNLIKMQSTNPPKPPLAKTHVVGWPPVRSFRKNIVAVQNGAVVGTPVFVKVSMDGAPYLRKVDLKMYRSYKELSDGLTNLFISFTIGNCGMKDFMNESKLMDLLSGSDFVSTYEDKDGDWMLVGDVPWESSPAPISHDKTETPLVATPSFAGLSNVCNSLLQRTLNLKNVHRLLQEAEDHEKFRRSWSSPQSHGKVQKPLVCYCLF